MRIPAPTLSRALVVMALLALVGHGVAIWAAPRVLMAAAMGRLASATGPSGMVQGARPDENARAIVMPSPDLLYAACVFDVSKGPVRLSSDLPDTYWSLSLFAANTDNFHVVNGDTMKGHADLVLVARGAPRPADLGPDVPVVEAPSARGIALFRYLITDEERLADLAALQHSSRCGKA